MSTPDLFLFAGEPSGDLHGEALMQSLLLERPETSVSGVGGPRMRSAGLQTVLPMEDFQVMGFIPVILALPKIVRSFYFLSKFILETNPKVVLFIDYPGFALRLEKRLKKKGFKGAIVHYICPSIWAWGKKRIPQMAKTLDLLISILPFEKKYFPSSFPVEYVGHPLVPRIAAYTYTSLDLPKDKKIISVFPGSRKKEIDLNFPLQIASLKRLIEKDSSLLAAVSVSEEKFLPFLQQITKKTAPELQDAIVFVPVEKRYDLMKSAYIALAKSGTVTLELALHKVPTAVLYAIPKVDLFIAKDLLRIRLPFYCIVNIILGKEVFKEFIGPSATVENLTREATELLYTELYRREIITLCEEVKTRLGSKEAGIEAAHLLIRRFL